MRSIIVGFLALVGFASTASAGTLNLTVDEARSLRLPGDATGLVIGNPAIADAVLHDGRLIFLFGKTYGATNIIVIDAEGRTLLAADIVVADDANSGASLSLVRGRNKESYACSSSTCTAVAVQGDSQTWFDTVNSQTAARSQAAQTAAGN